MKYLHTSFLSVSNQGRIVVPVMALDNDIHWIDTAELAQFVGITSEEYPAWLNTMYEMGAVTLSDRKTH